MRAAHATAIVVGEAGILLRGASGAGKSQLALTILAGIRRARGFAALIGDDRVWLESFGGRVVARGKASLAGVCERRGFGLVETRYEAEAVLRLLVDLGERGPRLPGVDELHDELCGVWLPRLRLDLSPGVEAAAGEVVDALARVGNNLWRKNTLVSEVFA